MSNFSRLRKGDRVVVTNAIKPVGKGYNGATATVVTVFEKGDPRSDIHHLHFDDDALEKENTDGVIGTWSRQTLEPLSVPADEVTIDFSIDRYRTAREYAARAIGTKMKEQHQKTLRAASRGERVRLLDLNAAIADAYRQNATRYGQSPARRQGATELSHLQYIVQGALSNVVNGLPPVEPGSRSPKIAALEEARDVAQQAYEGALKRIDEHEAALNRAIKQNERLTADVNEHDVEITRLDNEVATLRGVRGTLLAVISVALNEVEVAGGSVDRVLGAWDVLEPGFRHGYESEQN